MSKLTQPFLGEGQIQPGYDMLGSMVAGPGLTVKQTMKGCVRECFGCEDTSEYRIADYVGVEAAGDAGKLPYKMYALEQSSAFWRCCICNVLGCVSGREFTIDVSQYNPNDTEMVARGKDPRGRGGAPVMQFRKPCTCPVMIRIPTDDGYIPICCCCNLPKLESYDTKGTFLGYSQYVCDMFCCVPKWTVYNQNRDLTYLVRPDTCCCGCCIQCRCNGRKGACFYEPMVIRNPHTFEPIAANQTEQAAVTKVWSGIKKECLSEADNFCVRYPHGIDDAMKANLLGLTFLVDFTFYEGNNQ
eukprot:TRINITY_DN1909_c0_g1_i1.p1 TRINITY_DN1909_c0_g1~~TRINITY_DN1909_c0_g1_i1.p1  ORF type:complete len:300 (+),score=86.67 TRINITY_DN1909_c0_g1_i1:72-971(+)